MQTLNLRLDPEEVRVFAEQVRNLHLDSQLDFDDLWNPDETPEFNAGFLAGLVQAQHLINNKRRRHIHQFIALIAAKLHFADRQND